MRYRSVCLTVVTSLLLYYSLPIAKADGVEIKVGVSAPLTGELAEYGSAVRNGIELAKEERPEDFNKIKFIFEDNQYDSAKALAAFHKLHNLERVNLIYNWGEPPLNAIAPLAEKAHLPVIAMSLDPVPSLGKKYVVRSINHSEQYAAKLVEYFRSKGWKKIALLKTEDPFLNSMVDGIRKHLNSDESLDVFATFTPEDQDFKTQIAKLRKSDFDAIGVYLFTGQVSAFYRQASAQRMKRPTFGTDFFESKSEIEQSSGGMNGAVYPNLKVPSKFHQTYLTRFSSDAEIAYAYNAYEFAILTAKLFEGKSSTSVGPRSGAEIIELYMHPPIGAPFTVRDTATGGKFYEFPLVIKKIVNNEIVVVD